jgi:hypothetical protein
MSFPSIPDQRARNSFLPLPVSCCSAKTFLGRNPKLISGGVCCALLTIALLGGVLFIICQQGIDLGGLNSLAQPIDPRLLHVGVGVLTFTDACILGYLIYATMQKKKEAQEKAYAYLSQFGQYIDAKMPDNSYWQQAINQEDTSPSGPSHALLVKKNGQLKVHTFPNEEKCDAYTRKLPKKYLDARIVFEQRTSFDKKFIEACVGEKYLEKHIYPLKNGLSVGFYKRRVLTLPHDNQEVHVFVYRNSMGIFQHYSKPLPNASRSIDSYIDSYIDQDIADQKAFNFLKKFLRLLKKNEFVPSEIIVENKKVYVLACRTEIALQFFYFLSKGQLYDFKERNFSSFKKATFLDDVYMDQNGDYSAHGDTIALVSRGLLKKNRAYLEADLRQREYYCFDEQGELFFLVFKDEYDTDNQIFIFTAKNARDVYIQCQLEGFFDVSALEKALFGDEKGNPGIFQQECINFRCSAAAHYWPCTVKIDGRDIFAIILKFDQSTFKYAFWHSEKAREEGIRQQYSSEAGFIDIKKREALSEIYPSRVVQYKVDDLISPPIYWLKPLKGYYITENLCDENGKESFFALAVPGKDTRYFYSLEARKRAIDEEDNLKPALLHKGQLDNQYVTTGILSNEEKADLEKAIELQKDKEDLLGLHDIKNKSIYSLFVKRKDKTISVFYFISEEARLHTIITFLEKNFMHIANEILKSYPLSSSLLLTGDTFTFKITMANNDLYGWATRQEDGQFFIDHRRSEEARKETLSANNSTDLTGLVIACSNDAFKARSQEIIEEKNLTKILTDESDCWIEITEIEQQKMEILFYVSGQEIKVCAFPVDRAKHFIIKTKLNNEKQKPILERASI